MSDDSTERSQTVTRRRMLAALSSVGAAGVAGCDGLSSSPETPENGTAPATDSAASGTEAGTDAQSKAVYTGETIPPTSYDELASQAPTTAAPAGEVTNPVLTADDVTDFGRADYVADPYMFREGGNWHLFFEVVNENRSPDAAIGHASSKDGLDWQYTGIVLEKNAHTSYPFIWKWQGEYYMLPPTGKSVELWHAKDFPTGWERKGTLIEEEYFTHDPVIFRYNDRWWLFTSRENQDVMAFHSKELTASTDAWTAHSANPVVEDRQWAARQGGRPVVINDTPHLFFQDVQYEYGDKIRAFKVNELTTDAYSDTEAAHSPVLVGFGSGWNAIKMHHYDPWALGGDNGWRCAVDGAFDDDGDGVEWSIGIFDAPNHRDPNKQSIPYDPEKTNGYFRFDGNSTVAVDDSGNKNHGMIRGATKTDVGNCKGRRFEEGRDRVVFPTRFDAIDTDAFTLFFRGRLQSTDETQALFDYSSRHIQRRLAARFDPSASGWKFDFTGTGGQTRPAVEAPVSAGEPFQLAIAYKQGDGYRIFQDGKELTQARDVGSVYHEVCLPLLGSTLPGQYSWKGDISHFGVFGEALTEKDLSSFTSSVCSSK